MGSVAFDSRVPVAVAAFSVSCLALLLVLPDLHVTRAGDSPSGRTGFWSKLLGSGSKS